MNTKASQEEARICIVGLLEEYTACSVSRREDEERLLTVTVGSEDRIVTNRLSSILNDDEIFEKQSSNSGMSNQM